MSDKELRDNVLNELDWEPSIDAGAVGVTAADGVVTLSGRVPTYSQKLKAETVARRVKGVRAIIQKLDVRPVGTDDDEALAQRALNLLDWSVTVPPGAVKVAVSHGLITLTGQVDWEYQRRAAEDAVHKLGGIVGVLNSITLTPRVSPSDVKARIQSALERYADIEAQKINVEFNDGKVTLTGNVKTWSEHDVVESAVWAAPGVHAVDDRVTVG
jgi:osmotically-inducible protein OsmY